MTSHPMDPPWVKDGVLERSEAGPAPLCPPPPLQEASGCVVIFISHLLAS